MSAKGVTQCDLAEAAGIAQPHVSRIVNGQSMPSGIILAKIAARLRTTSEKLLYFTAET